MNGRDIDGHNSLMMAAKEGHTDTVQILLDHGADLNATDNFWITALMYATTNDRLETTRFLVDHKADVNTKSNFGLTAGRPWKR